MICSMTAFARAQRDLPEGSLVWELKSVNHRYLEVSPRLPELLREQDNAVREHIRERLNRGKVEATLRFSTAEQGGELHLNEPLVDELARLTRRIGDLVQHPGTVSPMDILRYPGVLGTPDPDTDALGREALAVLDEALEKLLEHRRREGEALRAVVLEKLDAVAREVERVREIMPAVLKAMRQRLEDRIRDVTDSPDPERLEQEIVFLAQKMDVEEEMDRLDTHIREVRRVLTEGGTVGRRLDFLMQELNREANTLASKSAAADTSQAAVELKVLIEQMREQIQNIE